MKQLWSNCSFLHVYSVLYVLLSRLTKNKKQKQKLLCTFDFLSINRFYIPQLVSFLLLFCLTILKNPQTNKNSKHRVHIWLLDPVSVITGCGNSHFRVLRSDLNTQTRTTHRHILIHLIRVQRPQPRVKWLSLTEVLSSETSLQILQLYQEKTLIWYQLMIKKIKLKK